MRLRVGLADPETPYIMRSCVGDDGVEWKGIKNCIPFGFLIHFNHSHQSTLKHFLN